MDLEDELRLNPADIQLRLTYHQFTADPICHIGQGHVIGFHLQCDLRDVHVIRSAFIINAILL